MKPTDECAWNRLTIDNISVASSVNNAIRGLTRYAIAPTPPRPSQSREIEQGQSFRDAGRRYRSIRTYGREIRPQGALSHEENEQGNDGQYRSHWVGPRTPVPDRGRRQRRMSRQQWT